MALTHLYPPAEKVTSSFIQPSLSVAGTLHPILKVENGGGELKKTHHKPLKIIIFTCCNMHIFIEKQCVFFLT